MALPQPLPQPPRLEKKAESSPEYLPARHDTRRIIPADLPADWEDTIIEMAMVGASMEEMAAKLILEYRQHTGRHDFSFSTIKTWLSRAKNPEKHPEEADFAERWLPLQDIAIGQLSAYVRQAITNPGINYAPALKLLKLRGVDVDNAPRVEVEGAGEFKVTFIHAGPSDL